MLQLLGVWGRQAESPANVQEKGEDDVDEHDEVVDEHDDVIGDDDGCTWSFIPSGLTLFLRHRSGKVICSA